MKNLLLVLLIFSIHYIYSQTNIEVDKLEFSSLYYLQKAENYAQLPKKEALDYCDKGITLAQKANESKNFVKLVYLKAQIYDYYENYTQSCKLYQQAAPLFIKLFDTIPAAKCLLNIGVTNYYNGLYDSAIVFYMQAESLIKKK